MAERRVTRKLLDSPMREAARSAGLRRFTSSLSCKHGHTERRVSNGMCVECHTQFYARDPEPAKARMKQSRIDNPEVFKARNAKYRAENKDKCQAGEAKWRKLNPQKVRGYSAAYRVRHNIRWLNSCRQYRERNKSHCANYANSWRLLNLARVRVISRNRSARVRNAPGTHTVVEIEAQSKKQGGKCYYCFAKLTDNQHADHYTALAKGGHNDIANIVLACQPCNCQKHTAHPLDFIRRKFGRLL